MKKSKALLDRLKSIACVLAIIIGSLPVTAIPVFSAQVPTLIASYDFNQSLDDSSGNGYTAVKGSEDSFVEGRNAGNSALRVVGASASYIPSSAAKLSKLSLGEEFTISSWMKWSSSTTSLFRKGGFDTVVYDGGNSVKMNWQYASDGWFEPYPFTGINSLLTNNVWTHWTLVWKKGEGLKSYLNGSLAKTEIPSGDNLSKALNNYAADLAFNNVNADIDSFRVYATALTAEQILLDMDDDLDTLLADDPGTGTGTGDSGTPGHALPALTKPAGPGESDRNLPLIAKWSFDDNMIDSVNGYGGSLSSSDSYVDSFTLFGQSHGKALNITGTGNTNVGGGAALLSEASLGDHFTITAWLARNRTGVQETPVKKGFLAFILFSDESNKVDFYSKASSWLDNRVANNKFNNTDWSHIAIAYDTATGLDFYKDGALQSTQNGAGWDAGANWGTDAITLSNFQGLVDDVHVYGAKLTGSEVQWDIDGSIKVGETTSAPADIVHAVPVIAEAAPPTSDARVAPLIAHYKFDESMIDEIHGYGGGLSASDEYVDSFALNGKDHGKALKITGTGQTFVGGQDAALVNAVSDQYTITAWIARDDALSDTDALFVKRPNDYEDSGEPFRLFLYKTVSKFSPRLMDNSWPQDYWLADGGELNTTDWTHIAISFQANVGVDFYKNGTLLKSYPADKVPQGVMNSDNSINLSGFKGLVDDLKIYSVKLSAEEVQWDRDGSIFTRMATEADIDQNKVAAPPVFHAEPNFAITVPPDGTEALPIIAKYEFEDNMDDTSGHNYHGSKAEGDQYIDSFAYGGKQGKALWVTGANGVSTLAGATADLLNAVSDQYTISAWIGRDNSNEDAFLFTKRQNNYEAEPFMLRNWSGGSSQFSIRMGGSWYDPNIGNIGMATTDWTHIAIAYRANLGICVYINGERKFFEGPEKIDKGVDNNSNPLYLSNFKGAIDSLHIYAVYLNQEQVGWDMSGTMPERAALPEDINKDPLPSAPIPPAVSPANPDQAWPGVAVNTEDVPLIANFKFEDSLKDEVSGLTNGSKPETHTYNQGYRGTGLLMDGKDNTDVTFLPTSDLLKRLSGDFTVSMWVYADKLSGNQFLLSKRDSNTWQSTPLQLLLFPNGQLRYNGYYGGWYEFNSQADAVKARQWTHVAVTFENGGKIKWYVNGNLSAETDAPYDAAPNENAFSLLNFKGTLDELRFYAKPLDLDEVRLDMDNRLATRPAEEDDYPAPRKAVDMKLVRVDQPIGKTDMNSTHLRYYYPATRSDGPDAVDWPNLEVTIAQPDGGAETKPIFQNSSAETIQILMQLDGGEYKYFQQDFDNVIEPGNHWFRGVSWLWGQSYVYSTDNTARSWMTDYELWTFPVLIKGTVPISSVQVKYDGKSIYSKDGLTWNSLTLLLPQSETGKQYSISVNGSAESAFEVGWKPVVPGSPENTRKEIDLNVGGFQVSNLEHPETFSNQSEWDADKSALSAGGPTQFKASAADLPEEHVGIDVPRSGVTTYAASLGAGMSGGFFLENSPSSPTQTAYNQIGTADSYAALVSRLGIDAVYEQSKSGDNGQTFNSQTMDNLAKALASKGVKLGVVPDSEFNRPFLQHPNLSLFSYALPEFHAPMYREIQLTAQRLLPYSNMAGVNVGADNAGYEAYWGWAPVIPNRPFGEALANLMGSNAKLLISPTLQNLWHSKTDYEEYASSVAEFQESLKSFNEAFKQFGYFNEAVSSVSSLINLTSGSYGSSPGVGASGGWNWGTIPVREMYESVLTMQAYDWNELSSTKPLHNAALIDRMRSYYPNKQAWSILDDFDLHSAKNQREADWAFALTRGLDGIGTNMIANDAGLKANSEKLDILSSVNEWAHKYGGTFALTEPEPSVGILYVFEQAVLLPVVHSVNGPFDKLYEGSHEGKTTEALLMLHAAGWPAKIITPEELKRGLPDSLKTIFLTGLGETDGTWSWYEGIEAELQDFVDNGGLIVMDEESASPVKSTATTIDLASFVGQSNEDQTSLIINRNLDNISKFNEALKDAEEPLATTGLLDAWAVPSIAGNTKYLTVINAKHTNGANELTGQVAPLIVNSEKADDKFVYDVRAAKELDSLPDQVDLTQNGFQYYALTKAKVVAPVVTVHESETKKGFFEAHVTILSDGETLTGIPIEITVSGNGSTATVYAATGQDALLPLALTDQPGTYTIAVKELLSGLTGQTEKVIAASSSSPSLPRDADIANFSLRDKPLTIALTEAQYSDSAFLAQAQKLQAFYNSKGRSATIAKAAPFTEELGIVTGIGLYNLPNYYPRWSTVSSDLILLGTDKTNALLLDQARGYLLPEITGSWGLSYVNSAFVGEYDVLNILSESITGIEEAVDFITSGQPPVQTSSPLDLRVLSFSDSEVVIAWNASSNATGYEIQYQEQGSDEWTSISETGTTVAISSLNPGTAYNIRAKAIASEDSLFSQSINQTTKASDIVLPTITQFDIPDLDGGFAGAALYADLEAILDEVSSVTGLLEDGTPVELEVAQWDGDYDPETPGEYILTGILEEQSSYSLGVEPKLKVVIKEKPLISSFLDREVPGGVAGEATYPDLDAILAAFGTVTAYLEDETAVELIVAQWIGDDDANVPGEYTLKAELEAQSLYSVSEDLDAAELKITIEAPVVPALPIITSFENIELAGGVAGNATYPDVSAILEAVKTVTAYLEDETAVELIVAQWLGDYEPNVTGEYTLYAELEAQSFYSVSQDLDAAELKITIEAPVVPEIPIITGFEN
ncbi:MAG: fibronectin type III domain-containing protein, partial [Clostridiales bacterium]|nr:fibronectin type III domain-containing protein [Clostridiales bacterium]